MGMKDQLKKMLRKLPPGGRVVVLYEGEQVSPNHAHPGDLVCQMVNGWRPIGQKIPEWVEVIPGYERPVNWLAIQEKTAKEPGRIEII